MRLTSETMEEVLDAAASGERAIDLRGVTSIDVHALLLLDLLVRRAREEGRPLRVAWPESSVRHWMSAMGFFADVKAESVPRSADRAAGARQDLASTGLNLLVVSPIAAIEREDDVSRLVGAFDERLSDRFPLDESPRRRFLRILLELFQNIPQHANATGDVDPHGLAALHDDGDRVELAVADKGIGLARSLALRGDAPGDQLSDADALRAVVFDGKSRFRDPGRGHELERIFRLVRSWEGTILVRSGTALLYQSDLGGDVVCVAPFPGVQIALSIPRAVFGIGEPAPLAPDSAHGALDETVAPDADSGFNEGDETDDV